MGDIVSFLKLFKTKEWEKICKRCGLCCYEKEIHRGHIIINFNAPCPYLNLENHLCTVYENRFKVCKECRKVTIFHALFSPFLPETCGYVEKFRFWKKKNKTIKNNQTNV